ncbi:hypothetical protein GCM10007860_19020 [Chitiniphilus shinanonensis]|uniref:HTH cro/C1-type domain-containing protein n=2 Tax=Chitiniphilus shinanonensis TaxID=553088 RepID=A0ABQ6BT22_9NEIS|nr:hypothetical protein GCM10007860_19020 [Chitiniphilus shinanonensis]
MSEQTESTMSQPHGVGSRLKARREQMGLAIEQVAAQLKLAKKQIEAIESDHYSSLPGNTFARGFVRNYAKLLGMDAAPLLADLEGLLPTERAQVALPSVREEVGVSLGSTLPRVSSSSRLPAVVAGVIGFGLVFGGVWWYLQQPVSPQLDTPPVEVVAPVDPVAEVASPVSSTASATASQVAVAVVPTPAAAAATVTPTVTPAATPTPATSGELRLVARGETWVQIFDADGRRVISEVIPAGGERFVSGRAPYRLKIGNAPQTRLYLRGKEVDLAPYTQVNVAAFELK